jgi:hypothetical protein
VVVGHSLVLHEAGKALVQPQVIPPGVNVIELFFSFNESIEICGREFVFGGLI